MSLPTPSKKIFVLLPAATGHLNPVVSIMSRLIKEDNVDVVFYSIEKFRPLIEKSGARFKPYPYYPESFVKTKSLATEKNALLHDLRDMMDLSYRVLPELVQDAEKERPDLIVFDRLGLPGRFLSRLLRLRYKNKISDLKPPKSLEACTSFASRPGLFPSKEQIKETFNRDKNMWFGFHLVVLFIYQFILSWTYGLKIYNPVKFFVEQEEGDPTVMTCVFPELQPNSHLFPENYKFIGCCIQEEVRNIDVKDPSLKTALSAFPAINPLTSVDTFELERKRLIYVSFGTVFGDNDFIIEAIISALKVLEFKNNRFELTVVFSLGETLHKKLQKKIDNERLTVPSNYILQPSVPQIEILKRAALFITHCGMNSTSETIHFGVPVIAIPLNVDQPWCAQRLVDDLKLGEKFDHKELDVEKLSNAIEKLLNDSSYRRNTIAYSKISRNYDGIKNGCELINYILDKKEQ